MFKWLDRATNFLLRFVYDCMKIFLIFVMIARAFYNQFDITGLFGYTAGVLLLSIFVNYYLSGLEDKVRSKYRFLGAAGIMLSVYIGSRFGAAYPFTGQMILGGYFVVVWMNGIKFITEVDNTYLFFRRFFQTFLIMLVVAISVGIGQLRWYISVLQPFFLVYFVSVIMNLVSMNLKAAYQEAAANIMQKSKRVLAFNIISIVVLTTSILGLTVVFSQVSLGWLEDILRVALLPVGKLGAWFSSSLRTRILQREKEMRDSGMETWRDNLEEMHESMSDSVAVHKESPFDQYIEWFFVLLVVSLLVGLAYYLTRKIEKNRKTPDAMETGEFRESMLTGAYIKNKISQRMSDISKAINKALGRDKSDLPPIRKLYRDYLHFIHLKGVSITSNMTPNEILSRDISKRGTKEDAVALTDIYNQHRYGEVPEGAFDKELLNRIEKNISERNL